MSSFKAGAGIMMVNSAVDFISMQFPRSKLSFLELKCQIQIQLGMFLLVFGANVGGQNGALASLQQENLIFR